MARLDKNMTTVPPPETVLSPDDQFISQIRSRFPEASITTIRWDTLPIVPRFAVDGDKHGGKSGWYVGFSHPIPAGAFGSWRGDEKYSFRADIGRELTEDERTALNAQTEEAQRAAEETKRKLHAETAERCQEMWDKLKDAPDNHPYLQRKQIKSYGLKITEGDGRLVVPIMDGSTLVSFEYIDANGSKQFEQFGEKSGNWYFIPPDKIAYDPQTIFIGEGYATMASVHEATGCGVLIAFDANNLVKVAEKLKTLGFENSFVFVADNDDSGVGQKKAREASAILSGSSVVMPKRMLGDGKGTDANDYAVKNGIAALRDLLIGKQRFVWVEEYIKDKKMPSWLIEGWILESGMHMTFGASSAGKTFATIGQALAIATEQVTEWNECRVIKHGPVIYLNGEGAIGFRGRILGWINSQAPLYDFTAKDVQMIVARWPENINEPGAVEKLCSQLDKFEVTPVLVIVDTLSAHMQGDENRQQDANGFINALKKISRHFDGCAALSLHHTGQSEEAQGRARGSSVLRAAMDIEINVAVDKSPRTNIHCPDLGCVVMRITKSRDTEMTPPLFLDKMRVGTGMFDENRLDENGNPTEITTLVLAKSSDQINYEEDGKQSRKNNKDNNKASQKDKQTETIRHQTLLAFKACRDNVKYSQYLRYDDNGKILGVHIEGSRKCTYEIWKRFNSITGDESPDTLRKKFERAKDYLVNTNQLVEVQDKIFWIPSSKNFSEEGDFLNL